MPVDKRNSERSCACAAVGEQLSAYLDGELSEAEAEAVEAHLRDCPDCARLCGALRTLRIDLAGAQLDPPPELHTRIMTRVRRENRLRRLRRITAAASVGVAAMFCFVIIGGAMARVGKADNAELAMGAPNEADRQLADAAAPEAAEGGAQFFAYSKSDESMFGGVIDTTLVAEPTIVATGLASDTTEEPEKKLFVASPVLNQALPETTAAPMTAPPMSTAPETAAAPAEVQVISVMLPETLRDLSRLAAAGSIQGLAANSSATPPANHAQSADGNSLFVLLDDADARLAEEQLGTLCVVERDTGDGTLQILVYDLITGCRLTLIDLLGEEAVAALGAEADTPYRPTAAGLMLILPDGETCLAWDANDALVACVTRYAMTKAPLCGVE